MVKSKSHDLWEQIERVFEESVDAQIHSNYHIAIVSTGGIVLYAVAYGGM